jgi:hypothetical protein
MRWFLPSWSLFVVICCQGGHLAAADLRDQYGTLSQDAALELDAAIKLCNDHQPNDALAHLEKAIADDKNCSMAWYWKALAQGDSGDIDGCIASYKQVLDLGDANGVTSTTVDASINLALIYVSLKQIPDADVYFTKAITLDPTDAAKLKWKAYRNMAISLHERHAFAGAYFCALLGFVANQQHVTADMVRDFLKDAVNAASEGGNILYFDDPMATLPAEVANPEIVPATLTGAAIADTINDLQMDADHGRVVAIAGNANGYYLVDAAGTVTRVGLDRPVVAGSCVAGELWLALGNPLAIAKVDETTGKIEKSWPLDASAVTSIAAAPAHHAAFFTSGNKIHALDLATGAITSADFNATAIATDPEQRSVYSMVVPPSSDGGGTTFIVDGQPVFVEPEFTDWQQTTLFSYRITGTTLLPAGLRLDAASNGGRIVVAPNGQWAGVVGGGGWRPQGGGTGGYGVAVIPTNDLALVQGFYNCGAYPIGAAFNPVTGDFVAMRAGEADVYYPAKPGQAAATIKGEFLGAASWTPDGHLFIAAKKGGGLSAFSETMPADADARMKTFLDQYHAGMAKPKTRQLPTTTAVAIKELAIFALGASRAQVLAHIKNAIAHGNRNKPLDWSLNAPFFASDDDKQALMDSFNDSRNPDRAGVVIYQMRKQLKVAENPVREQILAGALYCSNQLDDAGAAAVKAVHGDCGATSLTVEALRLLAHRAQIQNNAVDGAWCYAWVLTLDRCNPGWIAEAKPFFDRAGMTDQAAALLQQPANQSGPADAGEGKALPMLKKPVNRDALAPADLYREVAPSVVVVTVGDGSGSGFCIGAPDLIITNAHVLGDGSTATIHPYAYAGHDLKALDPVDATVVLRPDHIDLVVLRLDQPIPGMKALEVAEPDAEPGTRIFAVGSPGLGGQVLAQSITDGIVSATGRMIDDALYFQHTAAINPGNSGGPCLNDQGQVVGVNTLRADLQGVGFAIPASVLRGLFTGGK